jgi:hypothetical protein
MKTDFVMPSATPAAAYEDDFALWMEHQTQLLREGAFQQLDLDNLMEELEGMVKSRRSELKSRLRVLIAHLLKCQVQPWRKGSSWITTINTQRDEIALLLELCPSFRRLLAEYAHRRYRSAMHTAASETKLPLSDFPSELPYSIEQLLDEDFIP